MKTEIESSFIKNDRKVFWRAKEDNRKETGRMKDGYKKVWITLLILVVCAVGVGLFYWAGQKKAPDDEGLLVDQAAIREQEKKESRKEKTQKEYECLDIYILSNGDIAETGMEVTVYGI